MSGFDLSRATDAARATAEMVLGTLSTSMPFVNVESGSVVIVGLSDEEACCIVIHEDGETSELVATEPDSEESTSVPFLSWEMGWEA